MRSFGTTISYCLAMAAVAALAACGGGTTTTTTATATPSEAGEYGGKMAGGAAKMSNKNTLNVTMAAVGTSGQSGTATITNKGTGVTVAVSINEPKGASEPAHIHAGTCGKLNPAPWKPLTNVVSGKSMTTVAGVTVAQLEKGKYAINVHKSLTDLKTYVSCGNL